MEEEWIFYDPDLAPILRKELDRPGWYMGLIHITDRTVTTLNIHVPAKMMFITVNDWGDEDRLHDPRVKNRLFDLNNIEDKHLLIGRMFSYELKK